MHPTSQPHTSTSVEQPLRTHAATLAEQAWPVAEARFAALATATGQIIWTTDATGMILDAPSWRAFTGQPLAEMSGNGWLNALHPDDREHTAQVWQQAVTEQHTYEVEYRVRRADGVYRWFLAHGVPLPGPDGVVREWVGISTDISEEKRTADALRASEERFRAIFEHAPSGVAQVALGGRWLRVNARLCEMLGYSASDLQSLTFQDLTDPADRTLDEDHFARMLSGESPVCVYEKRYVRQDGTTLWALLTVTVTRDEEGKPQYFIAVIEDIGARKQLERDLTRSEHMATTRASQLEAIFAAIADGIALCDAQGNIIQANPAYNRIMGVAGTQEVAEVHAERMRQLDLRDALGEPLSIAQTPIHRLLRGETLTGTQVIDVQVHTLDGRDVLLEVGGAPLHDPDGTLSGAIVIFRDVTERRQLELRTNKALEALLAMAHDLVEGSDDIEGEAVGSSLDSVRKKAHRLADLTCSVLECERIGISAIDPLTEVMRPLTILGLSPADEQRFWANQPAENHLGDSLMPELVERLRQGETLIIDMCQAPYTELPNPFGARTVLVVPMRVGEQLVGVLSLDHGAVDYTFAATEIRLAGAVAQLAALVIERERLVQERAEAHANEIALREANRRMDEFLGMASHEIKTPLTAIKASIQLASRRLTKGGASITELATAVNDILGRGERQVGRLTRLVDDLMDVSRIQANKLELRPQRTDLATIVREVIDEQGSIHPDRTITLSLPADQEVLIKADPDRIGQVVGNYLSNALKYSPETAPVAVTLRLENQRAFVLVRDEGPGLSPADQERIWQRFYRVPGVTQHQGSGGGLGLGLHISRTIIERSRGEVGIASIPGQGATFWFSLPVVK